MTVASDSHRFALLDRASIDTGSLFTAFVLLHLVVWTALPLLFTHALPVDTIEGVVWGQGWQLSYIHPPLQAWLLGATDWLVGYQRWAIYLVSQILITTGFWAVWRVARLIVTPLGALVAVLTLEGVVFFNFMTPNLFPDLIELPFWALATWSLFRALRFGRRSDWLLLGLWLAGAAYAKYVGAILAAVMIAFMLIEPQARRCWRTAGPYLAAGLCLLLLSPHLGWIADHGFPTVQRFVDSARPTHGIVERLTALGVFSIGELGLIAPAGLLVTVLGSVRGGKPVPLAGAPSLFDRRFVAAFALGPILLTWSIAAVSGLWFRGHWGYAMWSFIGLFAVIFLVPTVDARGFGRFRCAWAITFLLIATAYAGTSTLAPYLYLRDKDGPHVLRRYNKEAAFPSADLADAITRSWREKVGERVAYVIGSKWVAGHVSFFSPDHPLVLRNGSPADSPWIDIHDVRRRGAVVVWDPATDLKAGGRYPGWLANSDPQQRFPMMEMQPPIVLRWITGAALPPLHFAWGIIYPSDGPASRGTPTAAGRRYIGCPPND
jgi:Dolichyl-phosphate-mannose-protein mannosyltransferase